MKKRRAGRQRKRKGRPLITTSTSPLPTRLHEPSFQLPREGVLGPIGRRTALDGLYKASLCLASWEDAESTIPRLFEIIDPLASIRTAVLIENRGDSHEYIWQAADVEEFEIATIKERARRYLSYLTGELSVGMAAAAVEPLHNEVYLRSEKPRATPLNGGLVTLPLVVGREPVFGVLQLDCRVVDEASVAFLHAVGNHLAAALDRKYQMTQQKKHLLSEQAAVSANQAKSTFLANVSHEIRTPLGIILGFTDLALSGKADQEERLSALQTIRRNGEQLAELVDDLLDLSKIEAGHLAIERSTVEIRSLIAQVAALMQFKAEEKDIGLKFEISGPLPEYVDTDPLRLRQCLLNVIGNAIKFTETGAVKVAIRKIDAPPGGGRSGKLLEFEVQDTGIGLTQDEQRKLFQPFVQADASTARKYGGTGLGLALSKQMAHALGGDLYLSSSAEKAGSTFVLTIGLSSVELQPKKPKPSQNPCDKGALCGLNVLVVEDAPDNQVLVRRYLERAGAGVSVASSGEEGIEKALTNAFDLVLMDIQMPGIDGYEATSRLRAKGYSPPVVAVTANAMQGEREKTLNAGFTDYLTKPINSKMLVGTVLGVTDRQKQKVANEPIGKDQMH